jgi:uncharacterized protein YndB with AHSA1/START domain
MSERDYTYVTIIAAPPERVWQGLTSAEFTEQYWHATRIRSDFLPGSPVEFLLAGEVCVRGEVLTAKPPTELSYTWLFSQNPEARTETPSRVTFRLRELPAGTELTVYHDRFEPGSKTLEMVTEGWPYVLAGLKTLLETGRGIDFAAAEGQASDAA